MRRIPRTSLLLAMALAAGTPAHAKSERPQILAPGWRSLDYTAPTPGTYKLPPITTASDGEVLREDGSSAKLLDLMEDRLVLFSFIYTRCSDINGCPLANAVLHKLQDRLENRPGLARHVRLLSMSFDPGHDSPEVMREFGKTLGSERVDWEFLTTRDKRALWPILDGYGQYTMREYDETGAYTGEIAHILRVYLIDRQLQVRNIYSVSFLHPDILINDLETLLLETSH